MLRKACMIRKDRRSESENMSSAGGSSNPRSERVPLRDVTFQNKLLNLQDSPKIQVEVVSGESPFAADETDQHQDVVLKSFVCLEAEVVVQDEAVMSEESVLIRRLALEETDAAQSDPDEQSPVDHHSSPCSASSALCLGQEENISLGSLVCLAGEVQVSGRSAVSDESLLMKASGAQHTPVCKVAVSVSGHSYCVRASLCEEPENTVNLNDNNQADLSEGRRGVSRGEGEITFKGLCCSGGEIEIAAQSSVSEMSALMENLTEEQCLSCLNDISGNDAQSFAALTPGSKHDDHIYCRAEEKSRVLNIPNAGNETRLSSVELLEKSESPVGRLASPLGNIAEKQHETEASNTAANQESSRRENNMESSDAVSSSDVSSVMTKCRELQFLPESNEAVSHFEENLYPQGAFCEDVGLETSVLKDKTPGLKDEEIEVMRLCDSSAEAVSVHRDLPSAIALTGSCTPEMPSLNRSVLRDRTVENPMSHLWPELPESPMPPPLLNSTSLANDFGCTPVPQDPAKDVELKMACADHQKLSNGPQVLGSGPLQEQLRQMAELLMVASGKVYARAPAAVNHHSALVGTSPVEMRSACVWSTPVQQMERSTNTSTAVEILQTVDVSDACTSTDSLLWNLTPGNLEHLSRSELEQRLTSTLVMVEVLSQQLTSARAHNPSKDASPSDLREKLIQTDHTELRQNGTYRDLYGIALERIQSLEHDQELLHCLYDSIQAMRIGMNSFKSSTEDAIFKMKRIGNTVHVDQETLSRQVSQMKCLYGRYKEALRRMEQKMKDMRRLMDESLEQKDAAFSVTQQLRDSHAAQVAELEHTVGSHQELMSALKLAYPSLVELSKSYMESISAANEHLRRKHEDHVSLLAELRKAQELIQRINPVLHQLHQRTATAVEISKQHQAMRDRAVEERDLMENELEHMRSSLRDASQQISDLSTQQTIMTSEMSVLREQLNQAEEERCQLQRRSTELSVTVTSTLASYTFLEQTLASETSKYAFLQAENDLAREQMEESERLLRCHLQGLRERNLECEDLKLVLEHLRLEKDSLQEELDSTRDKARSMLLEQGEQMAQASNDLMLLNHRVCCLTGILKESLASKESESSDKTPQPPRHPSSSFVDSVMLAMMKTQDPETESPEGSEVQQDCIGSGTSAFTRIPPTTHTELKEERRSRMLDLLCDFGETISDLQLTLDQMRVQKDSEQQTLKQTICGLQEALQEECERRRLEVSELRQTVERLQAQVEKEAAVLLQKAQDERNLRKLCKELEENMEAAHKHRAENSELRREVADLRRLEQQAQVEAQVLREELNRTGVQSAASTKALDERIKMLREVEKLKANLMETEENRAKVLERAKRHQRVHAMNQSKLKRELHLLDDMIESVRQTLSSVPDLVTSCPELQKLVEFIG
ncbi:sperm-associated antigen 5-like [Sinocyclocheilus anshuiensis]|uniref:sperm-associated antigen 5-like n=1 Tax=Sinocyclocheilus anshuiensis TaxID=1608454 RepID=UPI0007B86A11|nr:PREDICTED: sperm-associated antigen 5-like [Sinocyclocheilus anshuiensis]